MGFPLESLAEVIMVTVPFEPMRYRRAGTACCVAQLGSLSNAAAKIQGSPHLRAAR
jgi:hypothetical protein